MNLLSDMNHTKLQLSVNTIKAQHNAVELTTKATLPTRLLQCRKVPSKVDIIVCTPLLHKSKYLNKVHQCLSNENHTHTYTVSFWKQKSQKYNYKSSNSDTTAIKRIKVKKNSIVNTNVL